MLMFGGVIWISRFFCISLQRKQSDRWLLQGWVTLINFIGDGGRKSSAHFRCQKFNNKKIKIMKVKKFETVYGVVLIVMEEDGMLSFYGKRSCSDLLFLVGYRGSIEEVDNDVAANIAAQYESTISEEEEAIAEALEEKLTEDQ